VSVQSIYKAFGNKPALLKTVFDVAIAGDDEPVPMLQRAALSRVRAEPDPRRKLSLYGEFVADVSSRHVPIQLLVRAAAATDPQLRSLWDELEDRRLRRMAENAQHLVDRGQLRPGRTPDEARDVLWAYTSPDLYERLVVSQGWGLDAFERFLRDGMTGALLDPAR
jgi:AcrR family transcriptional regulator